MKKINLEQKILLRKCFFIFITGIVFAISTYYSFIVSLILYFIIQSNSSYFDSCTLKYKNTEFPNPDVILSEYFFWKIFCIIYYSIMLPMFFLGMLENKSLILSVLVFATPFLLIFFHGLIIYYQTLGDNESSDPNASDNKT